MPSFSVIKYVPPADQVSSQTNYSFSLRTHTQYYLMSPELVVEQHNGLKSGAPISIVYVPSHLYHMLFELFKNSLRAVVETHGDADHLPPIKVLLTKGRCS